MMLLKNYLFIIWDIKPELFSGFPYLRWYGIFWAIGILLGYWVMHYIYKREHLSDTDLDKLVMYIVIGILIGARFGHILFYDPVYYWNNPIEILPIRIHPHFQFVGFAGLASHGGVAGALIALYLYNRKYRKSYLSILDRLTIAAALLGAFIRLGNLMNSEIIGTPTSLPWAFIFSRVDQTPRHPAQLYEAIFYLIIFAVLFLIWKSEKFKEYKGLLFGLGLSLIFIQRFVVEFVKENQEAFEDKLFLNMGQILSIPMIILGIAIIVWSINRPRNLRHPERFPPSRE